jgi:hypothetical protein
MPPLISTIHKSPQHLLSLLLLAVSLPVVPWQWLLTEILQLHVFRFSLHSFSYRTELIAPTVLVITSHHIPHRKHNFFNSNSVVCVFVATGTCLPSCYPETVAITESLLKNGSICHSINAVFNYIVCYFIFCN